MILRRFCWLLLAVSLLGCRHQVVDPPPGHQLAADLQLPSAALYCDWDALQTIAAVRQAALQRHGTTEIARFEELANGVLVPLAVNADPADDMAVTLVLADLYNHSFEAAWQRRALAGCERVTAAAPMLSAAARAELRPWLERLLGAYHPGLRLAAATALVACGERSPALRTVIVGLTDADRWYPGIETRAAAEQLLREFPE